MYQECINYYVRNVRNKKNGNLLSISTQEQRALELKEFCDIVTQTLTPENLDVTLAEYKQSLSGKYLPDTLSRRISHAREFAEAIMKGDIIMNDNTEIYNYSTDTQGQDLAEAVNADTNAPEANDTATQEAHSISVNAPETKRPVGRPKNTSSQDKKFFNLQLPPDMRNKLDILAMYDECSITDIILTATTEYINARHEDIQYQIEYVQRKKERNASRYTQ